MDASTEAGAQPRLDGAGAPASRGVGWSGPVGAARVAPMADPDAGHTPRIGPHGDPVARGLIAEIIRLESRPGPVGLAPYGAALRALGVRCGEERGAIAEVYRWLRAASRHWLRARDERGRAARSDALADAALNAGSLCLRYAARLDAGVAPNLCSMLRGWARYRAREHWRWQSRGAVPAADVAPHAEALAADDPARRVFAGEVWALLDDGRATSAALRWVGLGASVVEAARRAGVSRQGVYRRRESLLKRVGGAGAPSWVGDTVEPAPRVDG